MDGVKSVLGTRGGTSRLRHLGYGPDALPQALFAPTGPLLFVARVDGAIVGFATLSRVAPRLEMVFVDPTHRRRGLGRALVVAAETEVRLRGDAPLSAMVAAGSRSEKSLFEALGYRAELLLMEPHERS